MVTKPFVCVTPLIVFKNILFISFIFSFVLISFEFIRETWEPGSYVPFTSSFSSNNIFTLINGVITRFFVLYVNLLLSLSYFQLLWFHSHFSS